MERLPSSLKLFGRRCRWGWLLVWRRWRPRPEEAAMRARQQEQRLAGWDERCQAIAEYHWAMVQDRDGPAAVEERAGPRR